MVVHPLTYPLLTPQRALPSEPSSEPPSEPSSEAALLSSEVIARSLGHRDKSRSNALRGSKG